METTKIMASEFSRKNAAELLKMNGRQLFDYYTTIDDDYTTVLMQAQTLIGEKIFGMLEKAEASSKRIAIIEEMKEGNVVDPPLIVVIAKAGIY